VVHKIKVCISPCFTGCTFENGFIDIFPHVGGTAYNSCETIYNPNKEERLLDESIRWRSRRKKGLECLILLLIGRDFFSKILFQT